jgi:hypothetical protein
LSINYCGCVRRDTFVFKHSEDAPSIARDGKSTAFVDSRLLVTVAVSGPFSILFVFSFFVSFVCVVFFDSRLLVTVAVSGPNGRCAEIVAWSTDVTSSRFALRESFYAVGVTCTSSIF